VARKKRDTKLAKRRDQFTGQWAETTIGGGGCRRKGPAVVKRKRQEHQKKGHTPDRKEGLGPLEKRPNSREKTEGTWQRCVLTWGGRVEARPKSSAAGRGKKKRTGRRKPGTTCGGAERGKGQKSTKGRASKKGPPRRETRGVERNWRGKLRNLALPFAQKLAGKIRPGKRPKNERFFLWNLNGRRGSERPQPKPGGGKKTCARSL